MTDLTNEEGTMTDAIDEILKADEEALKAKKARLQALAKKLSTARHAIHEAQVAVAEVTAHDGLSRSDIADTFGLSSQERRAMMPVKKAARKPADEPAEAAESLPESADRPDMH